RRATAWAGLMVTRSSALLRFDFTAAVLWVVRVAAVVAVVWGAYFSLVSGRLTAGQWTDLLVFGVAQGSVYALIALGYTMVYGVLGFINFAHGEVFMSGTFVGYFAADALLRAGVWQTQPVLSLLIVLAV